MMVDWFKIDFYKAGKIYARCQKFFGITVHQKQFFQLGKIRH